MSGLFLGVDIGTYESKGALTTEDGKLIASAAVGHELSIPRPGWVEHDAERVWWHDFVVLCQRLLADSRIQPQSIRAIGVSAIGPCVLPINRAGRPLRPAILYGVDTRASGEIAALEDAIGRKAIFAHSALHLSSQAAGPKILWIREHEPDVWREADTFLTGSSYLVFRLTGERVIDHYTATAYAPLYDIHHQQWSATMAEYITPLDRLPRLLWSVEVAGEITKQAARETGLAPGTPVIAGTADAAAEALSGGLSQPGDLMLMYGSSLFLIQKTARLIATEHMWGAVFLEAETYAVAAGMSTSGSLTRWFRDQFGAAELAAEKAGGPNAYAALAQCAAASPPGARGLVMLPYFSGERTPLNDPDARGVIAGLTLVHTRADLYRALLESVGYGIRHNIEAMREEGVPPQRILAVGGGTQNPLWLQIVSDIAGIEQFVPDQHYGASYGDAFMAGVGVGEFDGTSDAARWVRFARRVMPDGTAHGQYEPYFEVFRDLYESSKASVHRLVNIAGH